MAQNVPEQNQNATAETEVEESTVADIAQDTAAPGEDRDDSAQDLADVAESVSGRDAGVSTATTGVGGLGVQREEGNTSAADLAEDVNFG